MPTTELRRVVKTQGELVTQANLTSTLQPLVSNAQVRVVKVGVTTRDKVLSPIFSLRTGDRVDGTAITIDELAALSATRATALLRAAGLPTSGTVIERRSRLAQAMGVMLAL
ncbi:hypothetical protein MAPG_08282 [Magnaporthiopsis poae ATCC 64411]|uniref:Uncharacterized protein n=1 Tax=Magnaporthiopsis poae (strain ATCC 64411 / 73-15) TaxID=644358 RepID=A0A0C4E6Y2_MAGP6|nr:hypothetical protein MAPG_08282 [Magnaporthiopsis poae ATCC 64411]